MKRFLSIIIALLLVATSNAGDRLFFVSRNLNRNIIVYDLQMKDGKPDKKEPLHVYWYNQEKNPVTTNELSFIQRKLAYGYSVISADDNEVKVKLKAHNKREVRICKKDGKWVALTIINGKECVLTEIYAQCPSRTSCDYIELRGNATSDGSVQKEKVKK